MAVENVTYLGDLNPATPTGAAPKSEGDDEIRNIKRGLRQSFAGFLGAILVTGTDGGAPNAYTLTPAQPLVAYSTKMLAVFVPVAGNTGATTMNISGLGPKEVVSVAGVALVAGDLTAGRFYTAFYDGARFRLDNVTQNYVDQLVIAGTVPGVNDPTNNGRVFGSVARAGAWVSLDGRGDPVFDNGDVANGTAIVDYRKGDGQRIRATGQHTMTATGFPSGRLAGILLELMDYGKIALVTTGITWIKADGTETTNFAQSGITFPAAGRGRAVLYSLGDGVVYGKAA
ncbi:hypothetical protein SOM61_08465 [Massilia sp. CFBP9012]|uniref:hypothetical protein n=1 Tax=Massilia sp. CFBP9012 TaxID=3096531 RepID=UPI002A6ABC90|nr:hypothetical protein [Massilia sp. CFBP9012]MDY0974993.1 hypothetical protein [Massilia sp. CFBP9012]